jgi:hypothetical protein
MNHHATEPVMSQKIFSMNLGVETVSLYLLCCAVADAGATITRATLEGKWNGNLTTLERELQRLEERNILCRKDAEAQAAPAYDMVDDKKWR